MTELAELIRYEMESTKSALVVNYDRLGLRAAGKYAKSLEVRVSESGTKIHAEILGAKHAIYMEHGRGPNKRQDRGMIAFIYIKILEWMDVKGLTGLNPWLVARKIVREGIHVPNQFNPGGVISDVINESMLDSLHQKIAELHAIQVHEQIKSDLLTIAR